MGDAIQDATTMITEPLLPAEGDGPPSLSPKRSSTPNCCTRLFWDNGILVLVGSSVCFATMVLCIKLSTGHFPLFEAVSIPSGISFLLMVAMAGAQGVRPVLGNWHCMGWLLLRGALGAAGIIFYYHSIQLLPLSVAVTIFFTNPAWAALLEWIFLGEPIGWIGALSCTACTIGVAFVSHPPFLFGGPPLDHAALLGVACGAFGAFNMAASFVVVRYCSRTESSLVLGMWYHLVATFATGIPLALGYPQKFIMPHLLSRHDLLLLAVITLSTFFAQLLLNRGFMLLSAAMGSGINVLQVVFSFILDLAVLHDKVHWYGVAGTCIIVSGVLLLGAASTRKQPPAEEVLDLEEDDFVVEVTKDTGTADPAAEVHVVVAGEGSGSNDTAAAADAAPNTEASAAGAASVV